MATRTLGGDDMSTQVTSASRSREPRKAERKALPGKSVSVFGWGEDESSLTPVSASAPPGPGSIRPHIWYGSSVPRISLRTQSAPMRTRAEALRRCALLVDVRLHTADISEASRCAPLVCGRRQRARCSHLCAPARTLRPRVWTFCPCASFRRAEIPNLPRGGRSAGGCVFPTGLSEARLGTLLLGDHAC